jgi:hypothetical protein
VNQPYEHRAQKCIEAALAIPGLSVRTERWIYGEMETPELAIIVTGPCTLSTWELNERGMRAFDREFGEEEPWPLLSIETSAETQPTPERPSRSTPRSRS